MRCALRLDPYFRLALYGAIAILFLTGIGWILADRMKEAENGDSWQTCAAYLLMAHGGTAMVILMLLGALAPLHVQRAWRSRRNRLLGTGMLVLSGTLIITAFGLYYAGSDVLRPWVSDIHIAAGLALPGFLLFHVVAGARSFRSTIRR
jgi:hypothetical protein